MGWQFIIICLSLQFVMKQFIYHLFQPNHAQLLLQFIVSSQFIAISINERNCNDVPKYPKFKLLECCSIPDLFNPEVKKKCIADCSEPDFKSNPWCCMTKCMMEESEIGRNGTIDDRKAKNVFQRVFNSKVTKKVSFLS